MNTVLGNPHLHPGQVQFFTKNSKFVLGVAPNTESNTRMHFSRMCTAHFIGNPSCMPPCHASPSAMHPPLPCIPLCHTSPSAMHAPNHAQCPATPYHACPQPYMPLPCHVHPLPHMPLLPHTSTCHTRPPHAPTPRGQND